MDALSQVARESKEDEETLRRVKRQELKALNSASHSGMSEYTLWDPLWLIFAHKQHLKRRRLTLRLNGIRHSSSAPSSPLVSSIGISSSRILTGLRSSGTLTRLPLRLLRASRGARTTRMCGVPLRCVHFPLPPFPPTRQAGTYTVAGYFRAPPTPQARVPTQDRTALTAGPLPSSSRRTWVHPARSR
jgi:hypothetical protein